MNWIDLLILAILLLFGLRGYFRGLFREVLSLAGLVAGFMVAAAYGQQAAVFGAQYFKISPLILKGGAFVSIFFLVYFLFNLVGWLTHRWEKLMFMKTFNRAGGIAIGVGKGAALTALVVFFLGTSAWTPQGTRDNLAGAYLVAPLSQFAEELIRIGKERILAFDGLEKTAPAHASRL